MDIHKHKEELELCAEHDMIPCESVSPKSKWLNIDYILSEINLELFNVKEKEEDDGKE